MQSTTDILADGTMKIADATRLSSLSRSTLYELMNDDFNIRLFRVDAPTERIPATVVRNHSCVSWEFAPGHHVDLDASESGCQKLAAWRVVGPPGSLAKTKAVRPRFQLQRVRVIRAQPRIRRCPAQPIRGPQRPSSGLFPGKRMNAWTVRWLVESGGMRLARNT